MVDDWESSKPRLCSKLALFKTRLRNLKVINYCFLGSVQTNMTWGFQMSYYSSKESCRWAHLSVALGRVPDFFGSPTLTGHSFVAPRAMIMKSNSFESPKLYLLTHNLKYSIIPLLMSISMSWKVPIYYIKGVLMILNHTPLYLSFSVKMIWKE